MRRMKLIATLLFMKRITGLANQRYFASLLKIKTQATLRSATISGLLRMRRLLKYNKRNRLRKALYKWYLQELTPLSNYK